MNRTYCFFSARYLPYLGGVERYTYNLSRELVSAGNKVIIVTSHIGSEPIYEEKDNVRIYRLPSIGLLNGRFPVVKYNKEIKRMLKKIRDNHIDFVIINTRFYLLSYLGAMFARKNKFPAIVIEHGTGHFTVNNKIFDSVGQIYEHFISYLVRRNVYNFYGVSRECSKWLEHFNIVAKGVLYNAIDGKQIIELSEKPNKKLEKMIQYSESDVIITFTGRLIREKGVLKLISAFKMIKEKYPNVKLCVAGDGELYNSILHEQSDRVYLLGKLSFDEVIALLKLTTIFCLPTDYPEGLPTSVLEAAACKNYIITTKSGGAKEIIVDKSYGVIMSRNDIEEIQEKILEVLKNEQMRKNIAEKLYNKVINEFTWSNTASKLIKIFEE